MDKENQKKIDELYTSETAFIWELLFNSTLHTGVWKSRDEDISRLEATSRFTKMISERMNLTEEQRVIDIGSGLGYPTIELAKIKKCRVDGINISKSQNEQATKLAYHEGVEDHVKFHFADAIDIPFQDNTFDGAWFFESFIHIPDYQKALEEAYRVLNKDGILLIIDFPLRKNIIKEETKKIVEDFQLNTLIDMHTYKESLQRAGFEIISNEAFTAEAIDSWQRLNNEIIEYKDKIVLKSSLDLYNETKQEFIAFVELLEEHMDYRLICAKKKYN